MTDRYYREQVVADRSGRLRRAVIRTYAEADFDELIRIQSECFPPPFPQELWWNREQLQSHVTLFPQGALCVSVDGRLVGSMTGLLTSWAPGDPAHTWAEATDSGYIRNHDPSGNTLYVVDISVSPHFRGYGLGKWLMQAMYEVVVRLNVDRLLGGGRLSGYHLVADELTAEQYVEKVLSGEAADPVISFLLRCGRMPVAIVADYLEDEESRNYGVLMEWKNPFRRKGL